MILSPQEAQTFSLLPASVQVASLVTVQSPYACPLAGISSVILSPQFAQTFSLLPASVQVFTTGLCRTDETLALIYGEMPHAEIPELQEMNFGEYECHAFSELKDDPVFLEWGYDETLNFRLPGAETQRDFRDRVTLGLEKLVAAHRQQEEACRAAGEPAAVTLLSPRSVVTVFFLKAMSAVAPAALPPLASAMLPAMA